MGWINYTRVAKSSYENLVDTYQPFSELYDSIKKTSRNVKTLGKSFYVDWLVDTVQYSSGKIIDYGGEMPKATSGSPLLARLSLANIKVPLQVDFYQLENGDLVGDENSLDIEMKRGWADYQRLAEEIFWLPQDGFLCTVKEDASGSNNLILNSTRFLIEGMSIDIYGDITGEPELIDSDVKILKIYPLEKKVILSKEVTVEAGSGLVRSGCYNKYPGGVGTIMGDGELVGSNDLASWFATIPQKSYAGISRDTETAWKGKILRNPEGPGVLRDLDEALISGALQTALAYNKKTARYKFICDGGMAYSLAKQDTNATIIRDASKKELGYLQTVYHDSVNNISVPVVAMKKAFPHTIILMPEDLEIVWNHPPKYDDYDGRIWTPATKQYHGRDVAITNIHTAMTPRSSDPGNWIVITDIKYHPKMTMFPL